MTGYSFEIPLSHIYQKVGVVTSEQLQHACRQLLACSEETKQALYANDPNWGHAALWTQIDIEQERLVRVQLSNTIVELLKRWEREPKEFFLTCLEYVLCREQIVLD